MSFLSDRVRSGRDRQKQALIAEAGKAGAQVVDIVELGDDARAASAAIGGTLTAMVGGSMRIDGVTILRLQTNGWPHVYAQPFSGFNPLPGEHHAILSGCLPSPAILRNPGRFQKPQWDPAAGPEVARQLSAAPFVQRVVESLAWEWQMGMTKVTLDWAIQLRSVGNGTTHVVMQAGRHGGLTTYEVGFAQWMQVCQALHSGLAAWAPPAQHFPVPPLYAELIDAPNPRPSEPEPAPMSTASPEASIAVTTDWIPTVGQALAAHVGKKVWVGADTIPPKKLANLRAVLPPQLGNAPILAAIDLTVFGSASDAIVVTPTHLAIKEFDDRLVYELAAIRSVPPGQSQAASHVEAVVERLGTVRIPTGTDAAPIFALLEAIAQANAGTGQTSKQVSAFVGAAPGQLSMAEARELSERAQAAMQGGAADGKINAAAQLLVGGQYQAAIDAYLAIAQAHPEYIGTCYSQVGAALFFMGHYGRAIEYYEAAKQYGADPTMMDENIREARGYL
jgi:hypothetical protein